MTDLKILGQTQKKAVARFEVAKAELASGAINEEAYSKIKKKAVQATDAWRAAGILDGSRSAILSIGGDAVKEGN